jgi:prophage tail gpP-like protein
VTISATVQGWREETGKFWEVNHLIHAWLPYLKIQQQLLITKVTYSMTKDGGTTTKLELKDPMAFQPEPPKKAAGGGGKGGAAGGGAKKDLQQASADSAWTAHKEKQGG